ncbi:f5d760a0-02cf-410f-aa1a-70f480d758be [Thermothielavioides terrestris]|uniref:F5d760a0-02cf-410f-aa1a-70f480d758be n=1 Tax=Thermothielavioides terrestris TaxID=2587410 RepID=A0A3S4D6W1_9PEZI|nr:f5d760a0-02cf-410f-aa1a-70f480d758be [Thermothielavioides terrestris]
MRCILLRALIAGVSLVSASPISSQLATPTTCVADELLVLLRANAASARPFCRTYLGYDSASIVATVTPPAVTIVTTETRTTTHLATVTVTDIDTIFTTVIGTVVVETQTITISPPAKQRRQPLTAVSDYPAASISSACSCLNVRNCGKKATTTLPAATETSVASTVVIDTTETSTLTEVATTTLATTETSSATVVTVVIATPSTAPSGSRMVATTSSDEKYYLKSVPLEGSGDLLVVAQDASQAIDTFQLDDQGLLSFVSPDLNQQLVYPYFATIWWMNTDAKKLMFNTQDFIDNWDYLDWKNFQWVADSQTGADDRYGDANERFRLYPGYHLVGVGLNLSRKEKFPDMQSPDS